MTPTQAPQKIAPAFPGDEDWDYPPEIKELISLLARQAAVDYLKKQGPLSEK